MLRGKQKKLENLVDRKPNQQNSFKTPFLQEHSSKMVQLPSLRNKNLHISKKKYQKKKNLQATTKMENTLTMISSIS